MAKRLVIFGTGSQAELAHFYFAHDTEYEVVAFTVSESHMKQREFRRLPVVPFEGVEREYSPGSFDMFIAVGYSGVNRVRAAFYEEAKRKGYRLPGYVSPRCSYLTETPVGDNCFILEDNTIQPFVTIGNNVVMWSGNHIGHHSTIGDHCFVASHVVVSGHVKVGPYCFLGVNATIRDSISIGEACVIGAGALIMKSTKDKEVYLGERSKPFPRSSDEIQL